MRKQAKFENSHAKNLEYKNGDKNTKLREILLKEQKGFCAYTETYLGRTDQKDIDHFNPLDSFVDRNKYFNLFVCKSLWNKEKSKKWDKYQPVLSPLSDNFENRISYNKDLKIFEATNEDDFEAMNLVKLLKLDDYDLSTERRSHIEFTKDLIKLYGKDSKTYFKKVIENNLPDLKFIRSLEEEFNLDIWEMIP